MENIELIENLIKDSIKKISKIGKENDMKKGILPSGKSRLVFPVTRDGEPRFSEQEARLLFVQNLEKQKFYYSVETPTKNKFKGFNAGNPEMVNNNDKSGKSGSIDVSLHSGNGKRIALVEFKYGTSRGKEIEKDFLKLLLDEPESKLNYFIHAVEELYPKLIETVEEKYKKALASLKQKTTGRPKSEIKIFLFAVETGEIRMYNINKNLELRQSYEKTH